jgi:hypothetical protein
MLDDELFDLGAVLLRESHQLQPQALGVAPVELAADLVSSPVVRRVLRHP